jgi:hypothetical protein
MTWLEVKTPDASTPRSAAIAAAGRHPPWLRRQLDQIVASSRQSREWIACWMRPDGTDGLG